jgi:hypothetical protein
MKNVTVEELQTMLGRINARSTTGAPVEVEGLDIWHNDHPGKGPVVRVSFRGAQSRSFRCYTDAEGLRRWYDNGTTGTDDHWESTAGVRPTPEALAYTLGDVKFATWMTRLDNAARHHGYRYSVYSDGRIWNWAYDWGTVREALQQLARLGLLTNTTGVLP